MRTSRKPPPPRRLPGGWSTLVILMRSFSTSFSRTGTRVVPGPNLARTPLMSTSRSIPNGIPGRHEIDVGDVARALEADLEPALAWAGSSGRPPRSWTGRRRRRRSGRARGTPAAHPRTASAGSARPRSAATVWESLPRSGKGSIRAKFSSSGSVSRSVAPRFWRAYSGMKRRRRFESVTTRSAPRAASPPQLGGRQVARVQDRAALRQRRRMPPGPQGPRRRRRRSWPAPWASTPTMPRPAGQVVAAHLGAASAFGPRSSAASGSERFGP